MSATPSASSRLTPIQVLRGIAASIVVVNHYSLVMKTYSEKHSWILASGLGGLGASGVDIFFVISGFIMVYTTTRRAGPGDGVYFLKKRIQRIYPLYWIWTTVLLGLWLLHVAFKAHKFALTYLIGSYFLFPVSNGQDYHPLLSQGWTLSFEMLFYLVFALAIALGLRGRRWMFMLAAFLTFAAMGRWVPMPDSIRHLIGDPIIFEFLYGVLAAQLVLWLADRPVDRWTRILPPILMMMGFALLVASLAIPNPIEHRFLVWGVPSFFIVLGAALWPNAPSHSVLVYLGDASYSIYLTHGFMALAYAMAMKQIGFLGRLSPDATIVIATCITIPVTSVGYLFVERPIVKFFAEKRAPARVLNQPASTAP